MSKSIGIDLGTTNSVGAIKKVHTEVLKNTEGDFITPSCVTVKKKFFGKPEFVVGKHALEWMKQDPENTIVAVKRLMGRNYQDKEIQNIRADRRLRYQIERHSKGTENSLAVMLGGKEYTPEEISSKILDKIRTDSEKILDDTAEYAVITVPAYFNDKQKHATRTAAALAGLKVRRLLPEPTAAAVSFGADTVRGDEAQTVFVFDFGGGTFDLSVLTISGGQFLEAGKGGDMWLGGEDIDRMIADYVLQETAGENNIDDITEFIESQNEDNRNRFIGELKEKVEQAKIRLSEDDEAYIEILGVLKDSDGDSIDVDVELTRDQFDKIIAPMVEKIIALTRKMLEDIHYTPDLIDKVLLVGGSSRIPSVKAAMDQEFGADKVMIHERPMLAIAEGAAILSHRLSDTYECPQCGKEVSQTEIICENCQFNLEEYTIDQGVLDIVHSAAHDYYIHLENDEKYLFIEKNTPLPCEQTEVFRLVHSEQKLVHMKFYNIVNDEEESIGDLWLGIDTDESIKPKPREEGPLHVQITLKIDENNLIEVTAAMEERPDVKVSRTLSRGKADEKLFLFLEETINEANQKKYNEYVMLDLTYRSLSAIRDINGVVSDDTGQVNEDRFSRAELKIEKAKKMSAEGHSGRSTIYYAEAAIDDFGPAIPPKNKIAIRKSMRRLEEMDERGSYEDNLEAIESLNKVLYKKLGVVNMLMEIQKAGDFCMENNPSKAPKFYQSIENILGAYKRDDIKKAADLIEEIMPETYKVVEEYESKAGRIYKDITK
ncbi:Hsp70 family protein [Desulfonema magnum]|uniref:Chaperone protein DnaK-like domain-containing protein n=1 Tax=Desulfonema magnum TaxID=45655 RepID=A0A975GPW0_9BACT|nr:Hsp70 family protein [Desulfonema magnum]QTA89234.1 Chaperone protein DnaK-like domain-containing protein [Desulfonema magnum]